MLLPAVTSGLNASGAVGGRARTDHDGDPRLSHGQWRARRLALAAAHRADVVSARGIIIYRPGGPTTGLPHEWILALKQVVVCLFFLVAVACGGGGSSSPTAPTPTPTPPPPPPPPPTAQLRRSCNLPVDHRSRVAWRSSALAILTGPSRTSGRDARCRRPLSRDSTMPPMRRLGQMCRWAVFRWDCRAERSAQTRSCPTRVPFFFKPEAEPFDRAAQRGETRRRAQGLL